MTQPVNNFGNTKKWTSVVCLGLGGLTVAPLAVRFGYDMLRTVAPIPLAIAGNLAYSTVMAVSHVSNKILGNGFRFISNDYLPAMNRYISGNQIDSSDFTILAMGASLAVGIMVLGCSCFGRTRR